MAHAVRIHDYGGPEALSWGVVEVGDPGPGEARIRQTAIGLNYIDVYHRTGLYKLADLPAIIGMEGAGVVEALGDGVSDLKIGDR
ncbi:MAG: alcohol dehydrogenase catalytic domain-containing protein, partial [Hyphomicrobiaceae bacterium]|nr:alcohol dehydrogenase catalytic domain-containing protein [Hyphomicrobiaceae bacterium]